MKSLSPAYLRKLKYTPAIITSLTKLGEWKGKEELFRRQSPEALEKLLENAIIQSAESSNRLEGVNAPHQRIRQLVKANVPPRNRPEQEIAGYRDALNLIHQSHNDIPLSENVIRQFHSLLFRHTGQRSGDWKTQNNEIIEVHADGSRHLRFKTVAFGDTPAAMTELVRQYNDRISEATYDPLVLVPLFVLDFLCIHPFADGNGRVGRLLTLLLLYQAGYGVGKYISLERIIEQAKESYYETLGLASKGWHTARHQPGPWLEFFYGTMLAAYQDFGRGVGQFRGKGSKTEQVMAAIDRFVAPFMITDLEKCCPNVSRDMIRKILRDMRGNGLLEPTSGGRGAKWRKRG